MRKQTITISLLILALSLMFLIMSCGPPDQNANTGIPTPTPEDPCGAADIDELEKALRKEIDKGVNGDNDLSNHNAVNHNAANQAHMPYLKYELVKVPGAQGNSVYVIFEGRLSGQKVMDKVIKVVEKHVKKKCAFRVFFVKEGTLPLPLQKSDSALNIEGFEWGGCQFPMVACPDGSCQSSCP